MEADLENIGPLKCKFLIWLVVDDRCWTAERLAKCGCQNLLFALFVIKLAYPGLMYFLGRFFLELNFSR